MNQKQVQKRYFKEFFGAITGYAIVLLTSVSLLSNFEFPRALQVVIALTPMVPVFFVLLAILRSLRDSDELQQRIQSNAIIFSAVVTGFISFSYGLLEGLGFPHFPTLLILPMMFGLWGIATSWFSKSYQ